MNLKDYIVIVGIGRLGRLLAGRLSSQGHPVVVLDRSEHALARLPHSFSGFQIRADAAELSSLARARFADADLVFSTTQDDNLNLMIAQAARTHFHVRRAVARIADPNLEPLCERLGIESINTSTLTANAFLHCLP
jgi:trk system potassium uptake protein TrkA